MTLASVFRRLRILVPALLAAFSLAVAAADFPERPVKIVTPYTPGGIADVFGRVLGDIMAKDLGQAFVVDNKPGANSQIGGAAVGLAPADGYTLFEATSAIQLNPLLYRKVSFDPKALKPFWLGVEAPLIVVINPRVPAKTMAEFVTWARANAGKINYSSVGAGNTLHLAAEAFKTAANIQMTHIPYAGKSADAINAVLAGDVDLMITVLAQAMPLVQSGKLRALAVTSVERSPAFPDVPTVIEAGYPTLKMSTWYGLYARVGTPEPIVNRLRQSADKALLDPAFKKRFEDMGLIVVPPRSAAELDKYFEADLQVWSRIIQTQKIVLD